MGDEMIMFGSCMAAVSLLIVLLNLRFIVALIMNRHGSHSIPFLVYNFQFSLTNILMAICLLVFYFTLMLLNSLHISIEVTEIALKLLNLPYYTGMLLVFGFAYYRLLIYLTANIWPSTYISLTTQPLRVGLACILAWFVGCLVTVFRFLANCHIFVLPALKTWTSACNTTDYSANFIATTVTSKIQYWIPLLTLIFECIIFVEAVFRPLQRLLHLRLETPTSEIQELSQQTHHALGCLIGTGIFYSEAQVYVTHFGILHGWSPIIVQVAFLVRCSIHPLVFLLLDRRLRHSFFQCLPVHGSQVSPVPHQKTEDPNEDLDKPLPDAGPRFDPIAEAAKIHGAFGHPPNDINHVTLEVVEEEDESTTSPAPIRRVTIETPRRQGSVSPMDDAGSDIIGQTLNGLGMRVSQ